MIDRITINDVGPRDGIQNQPKILTVAERLQMIAAIAASGVKNIEVGSFVSPKAVPAMAGTDQVVAGLPEDDVCYSALIPNMKGYELARAAGVKTVAMVIYGSEGMAQANVKMGMQQTEDVTADILALAKKDGIDVLATITTCFECPFDGPTDPAVIEDISARFLAMNVDELIIADTIGAANPQQVRQLTAALVNRHGASRLGCHFHDTRAMGVANVFAAVESGVRKFDASIGGLGGCPFAPGATGNVATEDAVMMLQQMGFETGIDLNKLIAASDLAGEITGSAPGGRSKPWLKPWLAKQAG
jgi:hydroxymethylglutaryl-CoA lyase